MHHSADALSALDLYRLLTNSVLPRPIAWVSTRSKQGIDNLAPFSFFTIASVQPPVLAIVQLQPPNRPAKDTLLNLRATKECVVNIVTHDLLDAMNATAAEYPPEVSEFDAAHITRCPSQWVTALGVQDAPVRYECRLRDEQELANNPMGGTLILLDVVGIIISDTVLHNGTLTSTQLDAIGKLGGDWYCNTREQFERARPVIAPAARD